MGQSFLAAYIGRSGLVLNTPTADGTNGQFLKTDGSGTLSFATVTVPAPGGSGTEIQYRSGAATFGAVTGSSWDGTSVTFPKVIVSGFTAAQIGGVVTGPATPTADMWQWNPNGESAGSHARITNNGHFSCTHGFSGSESFGQGAGIALSTGGVNNTFLGADAGSTIIGGSGNVFIGQGANAITGSENSTRMTIVGRLAQATAEATAIGNLAIASGSGSLAIGFNSVASGLLSTAISQGATAAHEAAIAIGINATTTATNQFVCGANGMAITAVHFGNGVTNSSPVAWTLRGTSGSGTNIVGGNIVLAPGQSTGNATPATIVLQGTVVGASGTTAQTLSDVLTITNSTTITLADSVNVVVNATTGTKWGTATGQKQAWWGATPVAQQVLATGAGATVDNVISLLQTLGLCKQS